MGPIPHLVTSRCSLSNPPVCVQGPPGDKWEASTADTHEAPRTWGLAGRHLAALLAHPPAAMTEIHARLQRLYPECNIVHMPTDAMQGSSATAPDPSPSADASGSSPPADAPPSGAAAQPAPRGQEAGADAEVAFLEPVQPLLPRNTQAAAEGRLHEAASEAAKACRGGACRQAALSAAAQPDADEPIAASARGPKRRRTRSSAPLDPSDRQLLGSSQSPVGPTSADGSAARGKDDSSMNGAGACCRGTSAGVQQQGACPSALAFLERLPGQVAAGPLEGSPASRAEQSGDGQQAAASADEDGNELGGAQPGEADCCPLLANAAVAGDVFSWHVDAGEALRQPGTGCPGWASCTC